VHDLRSQSLEHTDLPHALVAEGRRLTAETPVRIEVDVKGAHQRMDVATEHHLLRIAQEAVTNAIKHSGGDRVAIELSYGESETTLRVRDNGRGIERETAAPEPNGEQHFGLRGMAERAERLGGFLHVVSDPGRGVEVAVSVPRGKAAREATA
jgi:signal transduction histidine kinase